MATLTPNEIAWLIQNAAKYGVEGFPKATRGMLSGGDGSIWATAVAIIMAESGGDPNAHNTKPPDDSYGLAQINMYGDLGPDRRRRFGLKSNNDLFLADVNVGVMGHLSNGGMNFRPWSTYTNGAYRKHMDAAKAAVKAPKKPDLTIVGSGDELNEINRDKSVFENFQAWVGEGLLRAAGFVGGAALLIGAIVLVSKKGIK